MKSRSSSTKLPASPAEWEAVLAAAPGKDRALTTNEKRQWDHAIVVRGGGYEAVRAEVAAKRKPGDGRASRK